MKRQSSYFTYPGYEQRAVPTSSHKFSTLINEIAEGMEQGVSQLNDVYSCFIPGRNAK